MVAGGDLCHLVIFPPTKMDPDQARQRDFYWIQTDGISYIVYLKFVFEKGKIKKKMQEKKRRL